MVVPKMERPPRVKPLPTRHSPLSKSIPLSETPETPVGD